MISQTGTASTRFLTQHRKDLQNVRTRMKGVTKFIENNPQQNLPYKWLSRYAELIAIAIKEVDVSLGIIQDLSDEPDADTFANARDKHYELEKLFRLRDRIQVDVDALAIKFSAFLHSALNAAQPPEVLQTIVQARRAEAAYDILVKLSSPINRHLEQLTDKYPQSFDSDMTIDEEKEPPIRAITTTDSKAFILQAAEHMETIRDAMLEPHMMLIKNPKKSVVAIIREETNMIDEKLQCIDACLQIIHLSTELLGASNHLQRQAVKAEINKRRNQIAASDERFIASRNELFEKVLQGYDADMQASEDTSLFVDIIQRIHTCYAMVMNLDGQARAFMETAVAKSVDNTTKQPPTMGMPENLTEATAAVPQPPRDAAALVGHAENEVVALRQSATELAAHLHKMPPSKSRAWLTHGAKALSEGLGEVNNSLDMLKMVTSAKFLDSEGLADSYSNIMQHVQRRNEFVAQKRQMETSAETAFRVNEIVSFTKNDMDAFIQAEESFRHAWNRYNAVAIELANMLAAVLQGNAA